MTSKRRIPQTVYLDNETIEQINILERKTGKTASELCRGFIETGIKNEIGGETE